MKNYSKLTIYILAAVIVIMSIWIFNKESSTLVINQESPKKGGKAQDKQMENRGGQGERKIPVSVYIADYEDNKGGLLNLGTILAKERVDLASEVSGRVTEIRFKEGESVKRGALLVKLNDDELQTQLKRAEFQYALLKDKLERQKILFEKDAVSRELYDQVQTEYNVLKQDIEQLKVRIEKTEVRAPFDGKLGFREISVGAYLMPNSKITTIVDNNNLIVQFSIPEKYASRKLIGANITFTVEGLTNLFNAKIYAIDPEIDIKTRTMMLRATYYNKSDALKPGMSAKVNLDVDQGSKSIYIPNEAVIADIKGKSVWIKKEGKAKSVFVKIGTRTIDKIEILSGIERGDTIIITGLMQVREGVGIQTNNF